MLYENIHFYLNVNSDKKGILYYCLRRLDEG